MLKKFTAAATAMALLGTLALTATPAAAQRWHGWHGGGGWHGGWNRGWRGGAALGGFAAGAAIGSALAARPYYYDYGPGYVYDAPDYTVGAGSGDDDAYCAQRFK